MSKHLDTKPAAISFASPVAPIVPSDPGLAPGSPAHLKHRAVLEAVRKQHAIESRQPPDPPTHELQFAHAQIRLLEQKAALQEREMDARLQQLEHLAAGCIVFGRQTTAASHCSRPIAYRHRASFT